MQRVQKGDKQAFQQLMQRYANGIHAYLFRMCQNVQIAEELTQETFLRVWTKSKSWLPERAKFTTWTYQIARNLCLDHFKKQRAQFVDEVDFDQIADTYLKRDEILILTLQQTINELPERQRTAFLLCQVEGWAQADVAKVLNSSVDAVESLLARARRTLKAKFKSIKEES